mmetsp:Transcript_26022/g.46136  ORF Transcript_26022/g.46136 Transcript_26022/m.46136 type:complete len:368 (+) Transcript_26022:176-1279(+)
MKGFVAQLFSITVELPKSEAYLLDPALLPRETTTTKEQLVQYLKDMLTIRKIEVLNDTLYKKKIIGGFSHLSTGQEAIPIGLEAALTKEDAVITGYRDHGIAYGRGASPHEIFAELMGRKTGSSKGKGGSMHFFNPEHNFFGGHGIVGAQVPLGAGLSFALKYKGLPNVAVAMYGDGASNQGQISEAVNMAGLWKLPMIFVCENNLYGMGTSVARASNNPRFYTRGETIPGFTADGLNVLSTREAFRFAKEFALQNGPIFLELKTYRYSGHSMSDPTTSYRKKEEIDEVRKTRDAIMLVKDLLVERNLAEESEIKAIEKQVKEEVDAAAKQAEADPYPSLDQLFKDVYDPGEKHWYHGVEYKDSVVA